MVGQPPFWFMASRLHLLIDKIIYIFYKQLTINDKKS